MTAISYNSCLDEELRACHALLCLLTSVSSPGRVSRGRELIPHPRVRSWSTKTRRLDEGGDDDGADGLDNVICLRRDLFSKKFV